MHYEFPFAAPDPADPDVQFGVAPEQIPTQLLELCEQFLRQASPAVHIALDQFLTEHGHQGGLGWFIDALGFTVLQARSSILAPDIPKDGGVK